jgi:hypothetical protein
LEADAFNTVTEPAAVQRRVWRNLTVVGLASVGAAFALAEWRFGLGVALGAVLALFNYWWLQSSLKGILATGSSKTPPGTMVKFVLRWILVALAGFAAYSTGYCDGAGILIGLTAPAAAVIAEASYVTFRSASRR